jgi:hypothetical protein
MVLAGTEILRQGLVKIGCVAYTQEELEKILTAVASLGVNASRDLAGEEAFTCKRVSEAEVVFSNCSCEDCLQEEQDRPARWHNLREVCELLQTLINLLEARPES